MIARDLTLFSFCLNSGYNLSFNVCKKYVALFSGTVQHRHYFFVLLKDMDLTIGMQLCNMYHKSQIKFRILFNSDDFVRNYGPWMWIKKIHQNNQSDSVNWRLKRAKQVSPPPCYENDSTHLLFFYFKHILLIITCYVNPKLTREAITRVPIFTVSFGSEKANEKNPIINN